MDRASPPPPALAVSEERDHDHRPRGRERYLVAAADGFVLIDTGKPEKRAELEARCAAGCGPGTSGSSC